MKLQATRVVALSVTSSGFTPPPCRITGKVNGGRRGAGRVVYLGPWTLQSAEIDEVRQGIQAGLYWDSCCTRKRKLEAGALAGSSLKRGEGRRQESTIMHPPGAPTWGGGGRAGPVVTGGGLHLQLQLPL